MTSLPSTSPTTPKTSKASLERARRAYNQNADRIVRGLMKNYKFDRVCVTSESGRRQTYPGILSRSVWVGGRKVSSEAVVVSLRDGLRRVTARLGKVRLTDGRPYRMSAEGISADGRRTFNFDSIATMIRDEEEGREAPRDRRAGPGAKRESSNSYSNSSSPRIEFKDRKDKGSVELPRPPKAPREFQSDREATPFVSYAITVSPCPLPLNGPTYIHPSMTRLDEDTKRILIRLPNKLRADGHTKRFSESSVQTLQVFAIRAKRYGEIYMSVRMLAEIRNFKSLKTPSLHINLWIKNGVLRLVTIGDSTTLSDEQKQGIDPKQTWSRVKGIARRFVFDWQRFEALGFELQDQTHFEGQEERDGGADHSRARGMAPAPNQGPRGERSKRGKEIGMGRSPRPCPSDMPPLPREAREPAAPVRFESMPHRRACASQPGPRWSDGSLHERFLVQGPKDWGVRSGGPAIRPLSFEEAAELCLQEPAEDRDS